MYTDGVTEARRGNGELYGDERLRAFLAPERQSARNLVDEVLEEVVQFQSQQLRDDIALIAIAVPRQPSAHS